MDVYPSTSRIQVCMFLSENLVLLNINFISEFKEVIQYGIIKDI